MKKIIITSLALGAASVLATIVIGKIASILLSHSFAFQTIFILLQFFVPIAFTVFIGLKIIFNPYKVLVATTFIWATSFCLMPYIFSGSLQHLNLSKIALLALQEVLLAYLLLLPLLFLTLWLHKRLKISKVKLQ